jgi:hypothetical protein
MSDPVIDSICSYIIQHSKQLSLLAFSLNETNHGVITRIAVITCELDAPAESFDRGLAKDHDNSGSPPLENAFTVPA